MHALYGENHRITDGNYDRSLAVKCINGTFVGQRKGDVIAFRGIPFVGRAYTYFFTPESSVPLMKSAHTSEISTVFNHPEETFMTGRQYDETFGKILRRMWIQFAKTGNPSLTAASLTCSCPTAGRTSGRSTTRRTGRS